MAPSSSAAGSWRVAVADARIRADGCYLFQLDGKSYSHTIAFFTALHP
jgi:hypothetical protein